MNDARRSGLASLERTGAPVTLITEESLSDWVRPDAPLPAAWKCLSAIDQVDYLRAYLMHFHGGGYSDIKPTSASWDRAFAALEDRRLVAVGYPEVGRHGVVQFDIDFTRGRYQPFRWTWWRYRWLQLNYRALVGNCAYIVRPGTSFTRTWLNRVNEALNAAAPALREHPARHPKERRGAIYDGLPSQYPLTWAGMHGDIFHPLVYRYRRRISQMLPAPSFADYQ